MYCQKCGSRIDNDACFCTVCGAIIGQEAPVNENPSVKYNFERFAEPAQQPRRAAEPSARRYADASRYEGNRQQPVPRRVQIDSDWNDAVAPTYRERPAAADKERRATRVKNEKWPVSVKVFSIISFIFFIGYYIAKEADYYDSIIFFSFLPYLLSSLLTVIAFFVSKKDKPLFSMIPLWIFTLALSFSIFFSTHINPFNSNFNFFYAVCRYYDDYWFGGNLPRINFVFTATILFFIFVVLYTISGFLRKKRPIAFPIIMAVLLLPTAAPFWQFWVRAQQDVYSMVFGVFFTTFLTTYLIAAFSTMPVKKAKPHPVGATAAQPLLQRFCPNCGIQYAANKKFCDQCGSPLKEMAAPAAAQMNAVNPADAPSGGFAALGFFVPLAGLILYLTWRETLPQRARSAGKGALIGVIVSVSLSILSLIAYFIILGVVLHAI